MKTNKMKGFTLVELLAVIVILAIILVIAVPKVMSVIEDSKKATLESTAKMIASAAEKAKVQNTVLGKEEKITCDTVAKINKIDYETCKVDFEDNTAKVTIKGSGKFAGLNVCDGTKTEAEATSEECTGGGVPVLNCTYDGDLVQGAEFVHNQYTYRYKQENNFGDEWDFGWQNIEKDGWGVRLTKLNLTDPVNTPICTYINGKPLVSTSYMFYTFNSNYDEIVSQTEVIDVSSWNTSTVTNMSHMFYSVGYENEIEIEIKGLETLDTSNVTDMTNMFAYSAATNLDLSNFNTSNVTNMRKMFSESAATSLDLSSFDTSKVTDMSFMFASSAATNLDLSNFDTSNVTDMSYMFSFSAATSLDLSSFDTSNVTNMQDMFIRSAATSLDLSNFNTSKVTNMENMFYQSAAKTLDLSSFGTSNVTDMSSMFEKSSATIMDLSSFDTSNVTNMRKMFSESAATSLDLSSFNTSNVTNMDYMFSSSKATTGYARTQSDADKFNNSSVTWIPSTLTFTLKSNG